MRKQTSKERKEKLASQVASRAMVRKNRHWRAGGMGFVFSTFFHHSVMSGRRHGPHDAQGVQYRLLTA
jgi:hypothetical protein